MSLTLITCTGGRPEAFALCERWMHCQSVKWDQWIVVDDCDPATPMNMGQEVIRPAWRWRKGQNTQAACLAAALDAVKGDVVAIIEDDDYYAPDYLAQMLWLLDGVAVAGEMRAIYYNVAHRKWHRHQNTGHASLCQTIFKTTVLSDFRAALQQSCEFIDIHFWSRVAAAGLVPVRLNDSHLCIGIKGLPGRAGIGSGHRPNPGYQQDTADMPKLQELIGADAEAYAKYSLRYGGELDSQMVELLAGQRVVIFGGASDGMPADEGNQFGVHVHVNNHWLDHGGQCDVIYHGSSGDAEEIYDLSCELKKGDCRPIFHIYKGRAYCKGLAEIADSNGSHFRWYSEKATTKSRHWAECEIWFASLAREMASGYKAFPLTGMAAVYDILRYPIRSLTVAGMTWYAGNPAKWKAEEAHNIPGNAAWFSDLVKRTKAPPIHMSELVEKSLDSVLKETAAA